MENPPTNLLVAFLEFCSIVMMNTRGNVDLDVVFLFVSNFMNN